VTKWKVIVIKVFDTWTTLSCKKCSTKIVSIQNKYSVLTPEPPTQTCVTSLICRLLPSRFTLPRRTRTIHVVTCCIFCTISTGMTTVCAIESFPTGYNNSSFCQIWINTGYKEWRLPLMCKSLVRMILATIHFSTRFTVCFNTIKCTILNAQLLICQ
jgi:hypothetical protein